MGVGQGLSFKPPQRPASGSGSSGFFWWFFWWVLLLLRTPLLSPTKPPPPWSGLSLLQLPKLEPSLAFVPSADSVDRGTSAAGDSSEPHEALDKVDAVDLVLSGDNGFAAEGELAGSEYFWDSQLA
ncbi:hypothetical protein K435DRAFT_870582 [Dendrothele bispora CBS 962.96]|uniref:Uncharacterized protein n=1 Tax=Dendrothele bispora (strain CBS 962.96) TaxID=1314807 RepID=A0A4S8L7I7_DENBC|nr:hypothetical protein K435DRAFT_870582 [Dendrothele bispora CBS 962.96]